MNAVGFLRKVSLAYVIAVSAAISGLLAAPTPAVAARQPVSQSVNEFDKSPFRSVLGLPEALVATAQVDNDAPACPESSRRPVCT
jgi:hypothetical protein